MAGLANHTSDFIGGFFGEAVHCSIDETVYKMVSLANLSHIDDFFGETVDEND